MKKLSIPERISLENYWLPGITKKEGIPLLLAAVPGVIVTVCLWFSLSAPMAKLGALLGGIFYIAFCYAVLARIDGTLSIASYVARLLRFRRSQKYYYYKHGKEEIRYVGEEKQP